MTEHIENENTTGFLVPKVNHGQGLMGVAQQREIAEIQSKLIVARMGPRNKKEAQDRILMDCARMSLAEKALYSYARGGTDITGESIRLAEVMAQNWGNFEFGIRELEQRDGESTVEAYAWDLETNVSQRKTFQVPHIRYSRSKGNTVLTDPRDIYEMVANQGARRMRACILSVIPGDVREAAVNQCEETLRVQVTITPEKIQNMLKLFGELGVNQEMIEARIQRHIEAITPALIVQLTKIYNSLKDGMSKPDEWFGVGKAAPEKGSINISDLKAGQQENRGHGQENLDQIGRKEAPKTPQAAPISAAKQSAKGKADPPAAPSKPAENTEYGQGSDPDPLLSGGDPFHHEGGNDD
jgi:hypothetical protein